MIEDLLSNLLSRRRISDALAQSIFDALLAEGTSDSERAAILVALNSRELSAAELVAFARQMQRRAVRFRVPPGDRPVDLCGSGGARTPSFNVSTVSAFVVSPDTKY